MHQYKRLLVCILLFFFINVALYAKWVFASDKDVTRIDVLMFYTPALYQELGSGMRPFFQRLIDSANIIFDNSRTGVKFQMVGMEEYAAPEVSESVDLFSASLFMEDDPYVREKRMEYLADFAVLIRNKKMVPGEDSCGVASAPHTLSPSWEKHGLAVFNAGIRSLNPNSWAACDDWVFVHELGHLFGCMHDVEHVKSSLPPVFPYAYGYDKPGTFATIMSYDYPWIPYFSNPDISFNGQPIGDEETADNARVIREMKETLADFFQNPGEDIEQEYETSPDLDTPEEIITQLYIGYFHRPPDCQGLRYWVNKYNNGLALRDIVYDFAASEEAQNLYPYLRNPSESDPGEFIYQIYYNLFGRWPRYGGYRYWYNAMLYQGLSAPEMVYSVIRGAVADTGYPYDKEILTRSVVHYLGAAGCQGQPKEFLLSAYNPPYAWRGPPYEDSVFTYYRDANFNYMLWARDEDQLIKEIHRYNFKYLISIRNLFSENDSNGVDYLTGVKEFEDGREIYNVVPDKISEEILRRVDKIIKKYKDDPNLIGYWICDEPFPAAYSNISKVVNRIKAEDPKHYVLINIGDNEYTTDENVEKFLNSTGVQVLCYDRYNFFNGFDRNDEYFQRITMMRKHALKHHIPFYNVVQAIGTNGTSAEYLDWRTPSPAEHRWLVYSSLAYGAHGIIWFHWDHEWGVTGNPNRDLVYVSIASLNAEVSVLKEIMFRLTTTRIYHSDNVSDFVEAKKTNHIILPNDTRLIAGFFMDEGGNEKYFMLMNKDYLNPVSTNIALTSSLQSLSVFNVKTNKWEDVPFVRSTGDITFSVHLRAGGGKLFRFE